MDEAGNRQPPPPKKDNLSFLYDYYFVLFSLLSFSSKFSSSYLASFPVEFDFPTPEHDAPAIRATELMVAKTRN